MSESLKKIRNQCRHNNFLCIIAFLLPLSDFNGFLVIQLFDFDVRWSDGMSPVGPWKERKEGGGIGEREARTALGFVELRPMKSRILSKAYRKHGSLAQNVKAIA